MTEIEDRPRRTRRRRHRLAGTVSLVAVGLILLVLGGIAATDAATGTSAWAAAAHTRPRRTRWQPTAPTGISCSA